MSNKTEIKTLIAGVQELQAEHDRLSAAKTAFVLSIGLYPAALVANTGRSVNRAAQKFGALLQSKELEISPRHLMRKLKDAEESGKASLMPLGDEKQPTPVTITMLELW